MKIIVGIFIFCIILFLYLHVTFQLRTSDDLDVYEIDANSKERMEEVCDVRQPVMFEYSNDIVKRDIKLEQLAKRFPSFDVNMRSLTEAKDDSLYSPVPLRSALQVVGKDTDKKFFSENNSLFLTDSGGVKSMSYHDEFLRPYMVSNCNYDFMFGSNGVTTPLRYEVNYRNYFYVTEGEIKIRMAPPKNSKYMMEHADYINYEFRSPINPWKVQDEFLLEFDKVKCVDVTITPGKIIFIPAYWWYSIEFGKSSTIACFRYRTYMNNISIIPRICMYFFQQQNLLHDGVKSRVGTEVSNETEETQIPNTVDEDNKQEKNDTM